jgi:hypothetical protein
VTEVNNVTTPALRPKVAEEAPGATVTLPGTLTAEVLELDSSMTAPPAEAGEVRVTVPVLDCPLVIELVPRAMPLREVPGGLTVRPKLELVPPYVAVTMAWAELETALGLAMKVVDVEFGGTVTVEGTLTSAGDEEMATLAPLPGAGIVNPTVHVEVEGGATTTGTQDNPFNDAAIVTEPLLAGIAKGVAAPSAAIPLLRFSVDDA